ncbi:MAG: DUF5655 domain-containing protein [Nitrososphaerales archaeon]
MDLSEYFAGRDESKRIFDSVWAAASSLGSIALRVTKSQIAFVRSKPFAWVWIPEMYLRRKAAPLVLTFSFHERRAWPRWKEIYEAAPGRLTHHLELWSPEDVDDEVRAWLKEAWDGDASERPALVRRAGRVTD